VHFAREFDLPTMRDYLAVLYFFCTAIVNIMHVMKNQIEFECAWPSKAHPSGRSGTFTSTYYYITKSSRKWPLEERLALQMSVKMSEKRAKKLSRQPALESWKLIF
jgi:hypothetical protein